MRIDFGELINRAFRLAWQHKSLWVFGLFLNGGGGSFNIDTDKFIEHGAYDYGKFEGARQFFEQNLGMAIGAIVLWILLIVLVMIICSAISKGAMIDGVNNITRGGHYRFSNSFSRGLDFFWRILGISILGFMVVVALILGVIGIAAVVSPWTLFMTVPLLIVAGFFIYHTFELAQVALVARDVSIGDALHEGYTLLMNNLGNCFVMSLVLIGIGIGFAIVIGILGLMLFVPLNLMVGSMTNGLLAAVMLGLFIGLPISLVLGGFSGTFFEAIYIQFYFRLVEPAPAFAAPDQAMPGQTPQP